MTTTPQIRYDDNRLGLVVDNLPELRGSPKQIEWADSIRRGTFETQVNSRFRSLLSKFAREGKAEEFIAAAVLNANKAMPLVLAETAAKWWIDNRNCDLIAEANKRAAK